MKCFPASLLALFFILLANLSFAANPAFTDIKGSNGTVVTVTGAVGSQTLWIDGTNFVRLPNPRPTSDPLFGLGTAGQLSKWTSTTTLGNSGVVVDSSTNVSGIQALFVNNKLDLSGAFITESRGVSVSLGTNAIAVTASSSALALLTSPTNDAAQVIIQLGPPITQGQHIWLVNGATNKGWTLFNGQANSAGSGVALLNLGDFVSTTNGWGIELMSVGVNWQELGRFTTSPGPTPPTLTINSIDGRLPVRGSATSLTNSPFRVISSGQVGLTNSTSGISQLFFESSNKVASIGIENQFGLFELVTPNGMILDGSGSSVSIKAGDQWQFFSGALTPGASNTYHLGQITRPFADLYITDNRITATNGILYINGIPIVSSPWTDDGTFAYITTKTNPIRIDTLNGNYVRFGTNGSYIFTDGASSELDVSGKTPGNVVYVYADDLTQQFIMQGTNNFGQARLVTIDPTQVQVSPGGSAPFFFDTSFYHTNGEYLFQVANFGTNALIISPNGGLTLGPNTASFFAPSAQQLLMNYFSVADGDPPQSVVSFETADSLSENYLGSWTFLAATNDSKLTLRNFDGLQDHNIILQASHELGSGLFGTTNAGTTYFFSATPSGLALSGQTNLIGMSAGGQLTVDGVPVGGASLWSFDTNTLRSLDGAGGGIGLFQSVITNGGSVTAIGNYALDVSTVDTPQSVNIIALGDGSLGAAKFSNSSVFVFIGNGPGSESSFTNVIDVIAIGYGALASSTVTNVSESIVAIGGAAFNASQIYNSEFLFGMGYQAGRLSYIDGSSDIWPIGQASLSSGIVSNVHGLWGIGKGTLQSSTFTDSTNIFGIGDFALSGATITNSSDVVAIGRNAGSSLSGQFDNVILLGRQASAPSGAANAIFGTGMSLAVDGTASFLLNMLSITNRLGGVQMSLADTNGIGNLINLYASTNSGSAVLYTEGSPPTATVPIGNDGKYDFAKGITVGGTNALTETVTVGLVNLTFRNGLLISHSP